MGEPAVRAAADTGAVLITEEHLLHGGLGNTVDRVVLEHRPAPIRFVPIRDRRARSGKRDEVMEVCGLASGNIGSSVSELVDRK